MKRSLFVKGKADRDGAILKNFEDFVMVENDYGNEKYEALRRKHTDWGNINIETWKWMQVNNKDKMVETTVHQLMTVVFKPNERIKFYHEKAPHHPTPVVCYHDASSTEHQPYRDHSVVVLYLRPKWEENKDAIHQHRRVARF